MKSTVSAAALAEKKKLNVRLAAAKKQAESAKLAMKRAKAELKLSRQEFKAAKRLAKKRRKEFKALKAELVALNARKSRRQPAASRSPKRVPSVSTASTAGMSPEASSVIALSVDPAAGTSPAQ